MYILELLVNLFKTKPIKRPEKFDPFAVDDIESTNECEHLFLPIDSTGETLACSKCGLVVNKKDLKDINIFKRNN